MTIQPPSDIVLEVAQSADPSRLVRAMEKLKAPGAEAAFADALGAVQLQAPSNSGNVAGRLAALDWPAGAGGMSSSDPYQKLEEFLLQSFVQAMLPEAKAIFGRGTSASVYKSMLAEHLAEQVVRAGGIGVSAMLAAQRGKGDA
jgi:flagellar protein FlgJ